jgi:hypothetical protein
MATRPTVLNVLWLQARTTRIARLMLAHAEIARRKGAADEAQAGRISGACPAEKNEDEPVHASA